MPLYRYKAANPQGALLEGRMDALSQALVVRRLQGDGLTPIRIEEASALPESRGVKMPTRWRSKRLTTSDLGVFTLELSTLLQAGLQVDQALGLMHTLSSPGPLEELIGRVHAAVRRGADLSSALEAEGKVISRFYLNIVRAGEASGALNLALARLWDFMERARTLRDAMSSALLYPIILLVFSALSLVLILGVVIPRISQMFVDAGQQLPMVTQVVVNTGEVVSAYWWVGAVVGVAVYLLIRFKASDPVWRYRWDGRFLRLPFIGGLVSRYEAARFARTLGTLLENDVPLLNGIAIARQAVANRVIAEGLEQVAASVRAGQGMAKALLESGLMPKLTGHLVQVGEQTGNLQLMLLQLADIYDREVQTTLKRVVDILGPALILFLGLLIAGIIMSVLMAILSVNELAF